MAIRNALDGQAMIDTAEGAHQEIEFLLQRMRELSVQAANDTNDTNDRTALQNELDALVEEIDRIAANTTWAGKVLLNGAGGFGSVHTAQDTTVTFNFHVGADETGSADTIAAVISGMDAKSLSVKGALNPSVLLGTAPATGTLALSTATASAPTLTVGGSPANNDVFRFSLEGQAFAITANIGAGGDKYEDSVTGVAAQIKDAINDAKIAGVTATSAAGVVTISKSGAISLASNTAAQTAIGLIDTAITDVNAQRAKLGAISNRLDSTVKNLTNIVTNLEAGRGRVEDADFAAETTNLAKSQILQQASMAMLAQANASKQGVLSLLQR